MQVGAPNLIRFGVFELDLRAGELRKNGSKLRLQEQPFQVLAALVEKSGEVVLREELKERLWADVSRWKHLDRRSPWTSHGKLDGEFSPL